MFKQLSRSPVIPWIGGTLIWAYMSLLSHTLRWKVEGIEHLRARWDGSPDGKKGWVAATWHSRILLMPMVQIIFRPKWPKPPHPPTLMVSPSKDGEFTRRAGIWLGLHIIRGSASGRSDKSKRGVSAAREAMEVMHKGGGMVITIDGPRGPAETVGMGTIKLAQQMGTPIIIYGLSAHAKRLDTWDHMLWPRPFARAAVVVLPAIETSKKMDSEELRLRVENALKEATRRADELCGMQPDLKPFAAVRERAKAVASADEPGEDAAPATSPSPEAPAAMEHGRS